MADAELNSPDETGFSEGGRNGNKSAAGLFSGTAALSKARGEELQARKRLVEQREADPESHSDDTAASISPTREQSIRGIDIDAINAATKLPAKALHRLRATRSILALVVCDNTLIGGLEGGDIIVWSLSTLDVLCQLHAHAESVLDLSLSNDKKILFSSGADSIINLWTSQDLRRLLSIHSHHDIGDVLCVSYSDRLSTMFCGSQNQSIQWIDTSAEVFTPHSATFPASRKHRFFDSSGPGGKVTQVSEPISDSLAKGGENATFKRNHYHAYAHASYIYCMLIAPSPNASHREQEILVTGGGDGVIKLWSIETLDRTGIVMLKQFKIHAASIFALDYDGSFLYAGMSSGQARVYNLESRRLVQRINVGKTDITAVRALDGVIFCGTNQGALKHFNSQFTEVGVCDAHQGKILASATIGLQGRHALVTGGNDCSALIWDFSATVASSNMRLPYGNDQLLSSLKQLVAFRTVSGNARFAGQCNEAAAFLRKLFDGHNAKTELFSSDEAVNPILYAKFNASDLSRKRNTVLFYGHYDVVDAEDYAHDEELESRDPFEMQSFNGHLYGRGVTDDKGPVLAALYAVADLVENGALNCDVIFLIEGEEESGSRGFANIVRQNRHVIGEVDWIMLSNSYWLDDCIPCLTYGMRGVVHASITVSSGLPDRHSGMDGKATLHEPLKDLAVLLGSLVSPDGTQVQIPGFYEKVIPLKDDEQRRYDAVASTLLPGHPEIKDCRTFTDSLIQRWREPNSTIHRIEVPDSTGTVTIPHLARVDLSLRIVPDQKADDVAASLKNFIHEIFAKLNSTNEVEVEITSKADPWLGNPENGIFQILDQAITSVWRSPDQSSKYPRLPESQSFDRARAVRAPAHATEAGGDREPASTLTKPAAQSVHKSRSPSHRRGGSILCCEGSSFTSENMPPISHPLYIREGGSIPVIKFLERELDAPAAMFPCGQASDNAHLPDERIRIRNLYNGREVLKRVFAGLPRG